jgi:TolB-like protein/DNA-binding transcriptional LysR family regulator
VGKTPSLDIDLLRSFVLIAEGESFTRAAARVGRTQAAISWQVQRLEALVGHQLFVRSRGGGVRLTAQGFYLLDRARELLALNDDIVGSLEARSQAAATDVMKQQLLEVGGPPARWASAGQPSIAVMPFQNLTGESEQEFFADGVVDDIVAGLSRIKWFVVIARDSTLAYRGRTVSVRIVGRELGVRYLLQGAVRKAGSNVRIAVRLVDAETAKHLWANNFDGTLEDVFDLQDQITDQVVGIVEPNVQRSEIERSRRKRPGNLSAYDLYLRALPHVAARMPDRVNLALPLLQQALRLDPDYAAAHALTAFCHEQRYLRGGFHSAERSAALEHARAVIASNTDDPSAVAVAGFMMRSDAHDAGIGEIDRALLLNPSCATALYLGAHAHAIAGHGETATLLADRALRLSPFDPLAFEAHLALGETALRQERYDDAAVCFARAVRANIGFSSSYFFQAIAMALSGRGDETSRIVGRGMELEPDFGVRFVFERGFAPAIAAKLVEGSRLLGFRE